MISLLLLLLSPSFPAFAQDPSAASLHWNAGLKHALADKRDDARKEWEACLKAEPGREDCKAGLKLLGADREKEVAERLKAGQLYFDAGRKKEARREWQACLRLDPGSEECRAGLDKLGGDAAKTVEALVQEAEDAYKKGDFAAANQAAAAALAREPGNRVARAVTKLAGPRAAAAPKAAAQAKAAQAASGPDSTPQESSEENRRQANKHWNSGIIYFQKGDYQKARDEWLLCHQFDAVNQDCLTGLQRIDSSYGAP